MDSNILSISSDIILTSIILYILYYFFRGTYSATIVKGLFISMCIYFLAETLKLTTLSWIFKRFLTDLPIIMAILFQQEFRRFLSNIGRTHNQTPLSRSFTKELSITLANLSTNTTGALIIIEGNMKLEEFISNGVELDAKFSESLVHTIFHQGTHLHDGAIIIRNERIIAAQVFLPTVFSKNSTGTRHEAGITVTQERDCISLIVSEETSSISYAKNGVLTIIPYDSIEEVLIEILA